MGGRGGYEVYQLVGLVAGADRLAVYRPVGAVADDQ